MSSSQPNTAQSINERDARSRDDKVPPDEELLDYSSPACPTKLKQTPETVKNSPSELNLEIDLDDQVRLALNSLDIHDPSRTQKIPNGHSSVHIQNVGSDSVHEDKETVHESKEEDSDSESEGESYSGDSMGYMPLPQDPDANQDVVPVGDSEDYSEASEIDTSRDYHHSDWRGGEESLEVKEQESEGAMSVSHLKEGNFTITTSDLYYYGETYYLQMK